MFQFFPFSQLFRLFFCARGLLIAGAQASWDQQIIFSRKITQILDTHTHTHTLNINEMRENEREKDEEEEEAAAVAM